MLKLTHDGGTFGIPDGDFDRDGVDDFDMVILFWWWCSDTDGDGGCGCGFCLWFLVCGLWRVAVMWRWRWGWCWWCWCWYWLFTVTNHGWCWWWWWRLRRRLPRQCRTRIRAVGGLFFFLHLWYLFRLCVWSSEANFGFVWFVSFFWSLGNIFLDPKILTIFFLWSSCLRPGYVLHTT